MKMFSGYTFDRPRLKCVFQDADDTDARLLLLREDILDKSGLKQELQEVLDRDKIQLVAYDLKLSYSHLSTEAVLKTLLPEESEVPTSFEAVGHIAHMNLRDQLLPYKQVIGQVILDKNPHIKTVVNKVGQIENEYRVFKMEVLAGDEVLDTEVIQHGARFRLNFGEVYWNSRLEREHQRLVDAFKPGETIADVMAGIGPFAIPAARKGCMVYANDLNPRSFHFLETNIKLNKVAARVEAFRMDGREFIRTICGAKCSGATQAQQQRDKAMCLSIADSSERCNSMIPPTVPFHHAVMNLPATAVEFLDAFRGAFDRGLWKDHQLPLVHCYTFAKGNEDHAGVRKRVELALGGELEDVPIVHTVRDVAPNKRMLCVCFRVPAAVAFSQQGGGAAMLQDDGLEQTTLQGSGGLKNTAAHGLSAAPAAKKQRVAESRDAG